MKTIIPAIDLINGSCVRLTQGEYEKVSRYASNPADMAKDFEDKGAERIHIVDLDAARGRPHNRLLIEEIRKSTTCILEVGGGVRSKRDVTQLLNIGIDRLVIGTVLVLDPYLVKEWMNVYGASKFMASVDAQDGRARIAGWQQDTNVSVLSLLRRIQSLGIQSTVFTNISKDGTLTGPDIAQVNELAETTNIPIILSGGIGNFEHVKSFMDSTHERIVAVICGKAIYEETIDLQKAFEKYPSLPKGKMNW